MTKSYEVVYRNADEDFLKSCGEGFTFEAAEKMKARLLGGNSGFGSVSFAAIRERGVMAPHSEYEGMA